MQKVGDDAMSINVGDISGCLEVISDCGDTIADIKEISREIAEKEWNEFSEWKKWDYSGDFKSYYHLNKTEAELYDNKAAMPESFIDKYVKKGEYGYELNMIPKFLYHKKKPGTWYELKEAFRKNKLYRVKCRICNRTFLMDERSFNCVKWRSCIGAECLKNTISEQTIDYSKSEYAWDANSTALQVLDKQLEKVEDLSNPLTYYGRPNRNDFLEIAYISDIHLMHHLKYYGNNENRMIKDIVSKLYGTMVGAGIIVFVGDTSSDTRLTMKFYNAFMKRYDYRKFLKFKSRIMSMKLKKRTLQKMDDSRLQNNLDKLNSRINHDMEKLSQYFDFSRLERYHDIYYKDTDYESTFEYYKKVKSYKNLMLSEEVEEMIFAMAKLYSYKQKCEARLESYQNTFQSLSMDIQLFEESYGKPIEEINMTDYQEHTLLSALKDVYVVLGNHEYIDFENVASCVSYYQSELSKIGIKLLHNNCYVYEKFMIYGGTGFAKYDEKWNADTVPCCQNFSREDEKRETELFEKGYKKALTRAKEKNLCFLSVSHYPISACLNNKYDKEAIYFTGHNHQNKYVKNAEKVLYADNQIGYKDNNIVFRIATTGFELNPYANMQDGLYVTTIEDYLQFYRYIGEDIGKGNLLYQRCQNGKANLYVIKRKGYYGFFIMNPKGASKGISIVNGGVTKKLTNSADMSWICENFDVVLSKYLQILTPLRNAQEQLSKELKELGLSGEIHGCIVDIDFYHHIMLNPSDGSMTFYYSSEFGLVKSLDSFEDAIESMERRILPKLENTKDVWEQTHFPLCLLSIKMLEEEKIRIERAKKKYFENMKDKNCLLSVTSNSYLIESENTDIVEVSEREEQIVSRTDGMYGVSRKVNPLQRLFSGHVLRDFDLRLTETKQESYRTYSYENRIFVYDGVVYKIIKDDGSEMILAEEVQETEEMFDSENDDYTITLTGKTKRFALSALKSKISNKNAYDTYWITTKVEANGIMESEESTPCLFTKYKNKRVCDDTCKFYDTCSRRLGKRNVI